MLLKYHGFLLNHQSIFIQALGNGGARECVCLMCKTETKHLLPKRCVESQTQCFTSFVR